MKVKILIMLVVLLLTTLACSFTVNIPTVKVGEMNTFKVAEPLPSDTSTSTIVNLQMGAGTLDLVGGAEGLIDGEIQYNIAEWKPSIVTEQNSVTIKQATQTETIGIPSRDVKNTWNLKLNQTVPLDLRVAAGAYTGKMDLSGLQLTNLEISDGASTNTVDFNSPNPEKLNLFTYKTGASTVNLIGLANANFSKMVFEGGAGTYYLDFSGTLQRDADLKITAGVSTVEITVPKDTHAVIDVTGGLKDVSTRGTWTTTDNSYESEGSGSTITIRVEMGVGTLKLVQQ